MFNFQQFAVKFTAQCGLESSAFQFSEIFLNKTKVFTSVITSRRGLPARGTKPLKQYLWDEKHLEKITNNQYTFMPLRVNRLGGRDPETGHKINQHIGGGVKFDYFMIDFHRRGPETEKESYDERVIEVRSDPNRTTYIALVVGTKGKRWILATENMKAGQIISTFGFIGSNPIIGIEGNAYPIGALVEGSLVNSIERYPTFNSEPMIVNAGGCAQIVRRDGDFVIARMPNKFEFAFHKTCMCTVGKLSNEEFIKLHFGSANMHRRFGYKMASGLFHKKDGYFGRKGRPLPPVRNLGLDSQLPPNPKETFTLTKKQLSALEGNAGIHELIQRAQYRF